MDLDVLAIRARLEQMRRDYQETLRTTANGNEGVANDAVTQDDLDTGDRVDDADQIFETDREEAVTLQARDALTQVEQALARLDHGTYGTCLDCGRLIDPRRLEAMPQAQYCLEDQEKHERSATDD